MSSAQTFERREAGARRTTLALIVALAALSAMFTACQSPPEKDETFAQAEFLVREARFEEAIPLLRSYLFYYPDDPGGHYYLGRAYYNAGESSWYAIAECEIVTALHLFNETGGHSPIERFSDEYFELTCHLDIARIHARQTVFLLSNNAEIGLIREYLDMAERALEEARKVNPVAQEIPYIQEGLDGIRRSVGLPPSEKSASSVSV